MTSTLNDIRLPSGVVVKPAATCAGEHSWYSFSLSVKHHSGRSIFSTGALIVAVKLESTISLSVTPCSCEAANKIGDPIGCGVQGEVPCIEDMDLGVRHIPPVGFW